MAVERFDDATLHVLRRHGRLDDDVVEDTADTAQVLHRALGAQALIIPLDRATETDVAVAHCHTNPARGVDAIRESVKRVFRDVGIDAFFGELDRELVRHGRDSVDTPSRAFRGETRDVRVHITTQGDDAVLVCDADHCRVNLRVPGELPHHHVAKFLVRYCEGCAHVVLFSRNGLVTVEFDVYFSEGPGADV